MKILVKTMMSSKYLTFVKCKMKNFNIEEASVSEMGEGCIIYQIVHCTGPTWP